MGRLRRQGIDEGRFSGCLLPHQRSKCDGAEAESALAEKPATAEITGSFGGEFVQEIHGYSFVNVSSRFNNARETADHAARSVMVAPAGSGTGFFGSLKATWAAFFGVAANSWRLSSSKRRSVFNSRGSGRRLVHRRKA